MNLEATIKLIEKPFCGNMNGVSVLICGANDNGKLAIKLARHSAAVLLLTNNDKQYDTIVRNAPQALNFRIERTNIQNWIAQNRVEKFDIVVMLDEIADCNNTLLLRYNNDNSYNIINTND